jgi:hypothetical protein
MSLLDRANQVRDAWEERKRLYLEQKEKERGVRKEKVKILIDKLRREFPEDKKLGKVLLNVEEHIEEMCGGEEVLRMLEISYKGRRRNKIK